MYKFPVTKNGKQYAVLIYKDPLYVAGFKVKLYTKEKILFLKYDSCIEEDFYCYTKNDKDYIKMLESKTLYKTFSEWVIEKYEKRTYKDNLLAENERIFESWDGNFNDL